MAQSKSTTADNRGRNYATVVYPESAPDGWKEILAGHFIPAFISPLHDRDINATGEPKKPHFHVILLYDGKKSEAQAREIFDTIGGVGCERVNSIRGYARYLCHLDNPEKAQYDQGQVTCLCGSDYAAMIGLATDKYKALTEMEDFCDQYNVTSFYLLARYASRYRTDWSRVLKDNGSIYMREFLQSRKWSIDQGEVAIIDPETGEAIAI